MIDSAARTVSVTNRRAADAATAPTLYAALIKPSTDNRGAAAVGGGLADRRRSGMERRLPDIIPLRHQPVAGSIPSRLGTKKAADPRSAAFPERRVLCLYRFTS